MKKTYFQKTMDKLISEKEENIQKLAKLSFEDLYARRKELYQLYSDAEECGYKEAAKVNYFKYRIIDEALEVKTTNEMDSWDLLT